MNKPIDTGFGLVIFINKRNKNIEIKNQLNDSTTIITPRGSKVELW